MRLREIQAKLLRSMSIFDRLTDVRDIVADGVGLSVLGVSRADLQTLLEDLADIPVLREDAAVISRLQVMTLAREHQGKFAGPADLTLPLLKDLDRLADRVMTIGEFLDEVLPPSSDNAMYVRIPKVDTLAELSAISKDLEIIFDQTSRRVTGEGVSLQGVDQGSVVLEISAVSAVVLVFISKLVAFANKLAREAAEHERVLAKYSFGDALHAKIVEAQVAMLEKVRRDFAESIVRDSSGAPKLDGEQINITITALERLSGLMRQNTQFELSEGAPKEAVAAFPTKEDVKALETALKPVIGLIGSGSADGDGQ